MTWHGGGRLDVVTRWDLGSGWVEIDQGDVMGEGRGTIEIERGRSDEMRDSDPSRCRLQLRNTAGQFSPRNPTGPWFGSFGRNTPLQVGVREGGTFLRYPGPDFGSEGATRSAGARVTTPDSAGLSITGDLDVRLDLELDTWRPAAATDLIGKWTGTAGQKSWELILTAGGYLNLFWSVLGTIEIGTGYASTEPVPISTGRLTVRFTLDVDNGASGHTLRYYTATDGVGGTFVQLGSGLVGTSGTTAIFDSTTAVTIGDTATGSQANTIRGKAYGARIYQGIAGTLRADVDFTAQTAGATSFSDGTNTWTLTGVTLDDVDVRFTGEVPAWPPQVDPSGRDEWVDLEAAGILRRLSQGDSPVMSTFRRGILGLGTTLVKAYWPLEDGSDSTQFGSGLDGGKPMKWTGATPSLASYDGFSCSRPLPGMNGAQLVGAVPNYSFGSATQLLFLMRLPTGTTDASIIARITCASSRWDLRYNTGGSLTLLWYDSSGTAVGNSGAIGFAVNDQLLWVSVALTPSGADVLYEITTLEVGESVGGTSGGTATGITLGRASAVRMNTQSASLGSDAIIGHIMVTNAVISIFSLFQQLNAYRGETAGRRVERLCEEQGVPFVGYGALSDTVEMGPQGPTNFLTLVRECADADGGMLGEARDALALAYRTRESLERQTPLVSLDYDGGDLSVYAPTEDDRALANDVTVTRASAGTGVKGAAARAVDTTSSLSTSDPPAGVGMGYDTGLTLNLETDEQLEQHASWRLHLGTVDEQRFPDGIGVQLARPAFSVSSRRRTIRAANLGDVLTVTDPPASLGAPDDVRQLVQGVKETITQLRHGVLWMVSPASPYDTGTWWDGSSLQAAESRYDTDGCTLGTPWASQSATFNGSRCLSMAGATPTDLDVRVKCTATDWTPSSEKIAIAKYNNTGNQRTFAFGINTSGQPILYMSNDGTANTLTTGSAAYGFTDGTEHWIRATLDVNDGAGHYVIKFWKSDDGVTWTQVGTTTTGGATTTLFAGTADFQLGARSGSAVTSGWTGSIVGSEVYSIIDDTSINMVPFDPADWTTDGYGGSGTGTVRANLTTGVTMALVVPSGPLWTHADGDYDLRAGGEDVTLTAVSGTSSPQLGTFTRSANGVVKGHDRSEAISLAHPVYWSL